MSSQKPKSADDHTSSRQNQPLLNSLLARDKANYRILSKLFLVLLVITGVGIGAALYHRQGYSYKEELDTALSNITNVSEGKVSVSTAQSGIDAEVETIFTAAPGQPQKKLVHLDYMQSSDNSSDDVQLLDLFKTPLAELPIKDQRLWVTIETEDDIKSLESLGFPVKTLINESAHTPLLPFGNFSDSQQQEINHQIKQAFADAEFIRADNGLLEFQAVISKKEATSIVNSTLNTAEPMDMTAIDRLYADNDKVILTAKIDRRDKRLVGLKMATEIDDHELTAIYKFDYDKVELPKSQPKSITAEQFVDRYLKNLRSKD